MKKIVFILLFFIGIGSLVAQTKLIAHKSHSGTSASFVYSESMNGTFNKGLGLGPEPDRYSAGNDMIITNGLNKNMTMSVLDSIIYVSDTVSALAVTTFYTETIYPDSLLVKSDVFIFHHAAVYNVDTIKKIVVNRNSRFGTSVDRVKFIGYDHIVPVNRGKNKKNELYPVVSIKDRPPFDFNLLFYATCVALISMLVGLLSWKLYQVKLLMHKI